MKYFFLLLLIVFEKNYGQIIVKPRPIKVVNSLQLIDGKHSLSALDALQILADLASIRNEIFVQKPEEKNRELVLGLWENWDSAFIKDFKSVQKYTDKFFNVLYPFAFEDSFSLFPHIYLSCCSDSNGCTSVKYELKKYKQNKLNLEERLQLLLDILELRPAYKIDTAEDKKITIRIILVLDSSSYWNQYISFTAYSQYLALAIHYYVLPKKEKKKRKRFDSVLITFLNPDATFRESFKYFFNQPIFSKMYALPFFQLDENKVL